MILKKQHAALPPHKRDPSIQCMASDFKKQLLLLLLLLLSSSSSSSSSLLLVVLLLLFVAFGYHPRSHRKNPRNQHHPTMLTRHRPQLLHFSYGSRTTKHQSPRPLTRPQLDRWPEDDLKSKKNGVTMKKEKFKRNDQCDTHIHIYLYIYTWKWI